MSKLNLDKLNNLCLFAQLNSHFQEGWNESFSVDISEQFLPKFGGNSNGRWTSPWKVKLTLGPLSPAQA